MPGDRGPITRARSSASPLTPAALFRGWPPKAAGLIVTIYGDVVEPRGGVLWMGTLIEIADAFGLTETVVRTAVSRLVGSGRLIGERVGRRSYYRLTSEASIEFQAAARILYGAEPESKGWWIVSQVSAEVADRLTQEGFASMGQDWLIGPDLGGPPMGVGLSFRASLEHGAEYLPIAAARLWGLHRHGQAYEAFLERFRPVLNQVRATAHLPDREALIVRLALVHEYRAVLLRTPRLPSEALPSDWPGHTARELFATLYSILSPAGNRYVGREFQGFDGPLQSETAATRSRAAALGVFVKSA